MRKIRRFFKKLKYALKIGVWGFKSTPWNEYDKLFNLICFQLEVMAAEFERTDFTMTSQQDAKDMRKAIRLIKSGLADERWERYHATHYHFEDVIQEGIDLNDDPSKSHLPPYKIEEVLEASKQDNRAIELGLKLIAHKHLGWWQ